MRARRLASWLIAATLGAAAASGAALSEPPLVAAARAGDLPGVRRLLAARTDVNLSDVEGATALHWAAERNDLAVAEILLKAGAIVAPANRHGVTPLFLAAANASTDVLERLLDAGARADTTSVDGETALMAAARTGSVRAVTVLLERGAAPNAREQWRGQTALMWAAAQKHAPIVRLLIAHGAEVDVRTTSGFSALLFAARSGDAASVGALVEAGADVNQTMKDGTSVLVVAITNAHYELAAWLLSKGADPNRGAPGGTPLHSAIRSRNPETVAMPDPVPTGNLDDVGFIRTLLSHGANVNARLAKGPTSTFLNLTGATPFLLAAHYVDAPLMQVLLAAGADPRISTNDNTPPLTAAAGLGFDEGRHTAWREAASLAAVKMVLDTGADVNAIDNNGNTALHGAALTGANSVVRLLVEKGARLDVQNKLGYLPVTIAEGIHLGALLKYRPETGALMRQLMAGTAK
jgi:uncharacterized protein